LSFDVWESLIDIQEMLQQKFAETGSVTHEDGMERFNQNGWKNLTWESNLFRRAHIDVVDARDTKGLWMMHCCIFPHLHSNAPIFGLDVIAGKKKITGFFHDYSPTTTKDHRMIVDFGDMISKYHWKKERVLPDWAKQIFTENMLAAGNVTDDVELNQLVALSRVSIDYYLSKIGDYHHTESSSEITRSSQNRYAFFQKQNPHTPRTMKALGLGEEDVDLFINKCLFPDI
jgi:hypothetical protein